MKQVNQVGVDVDSEKLVCARQCAGHRMPLATFANTAAGPPTRCGPKIKACTGGSG